MTRQILSQNDLSRHLLNARQVAAIATAFALPLSTSGQAIGVAVLAVLSLLTLDRTRAVETMRRPAAYLPVVLFALMLLGVAWSILPFNDALKWVGPYGKLLLIPLLMASAITPRQVLQIGLGFLAACLLVLVLSYTSMVWPTGPWQWFNAPGVPVKDNAIQSECFAFCGFGLLYFAWRCWTQTHYLRAGLIALLATLFFANIFMIFISRTGTLVMMSLLGLLLIQIAGWRRALWIGVPVLIVLVIALGSSARVQSRIAEVAKGFSEHGQSNESQSTSSRLDFWTKAWSFAQIAPLSGHGTGSIRPLYQSRELTAPSPYGSATADPHNQFLHVVLQIGLLGGFVLLAMWASHAMLFFSRDVVGTFGLAMVWLNVLGSMFNSHISQVTQGMLYCVAVGLLGALVPAQSAAPKNSSAAVVNARA